MTATDTFVGEGGVMHSAPARKAFTISPSDSSELTYVTRGIYTGAGGAIAVILVDDTSSVTFANVPAGIVLPLRARQVKSTGTTATGLIGLM